MRAKPVIQALRGQHQQVLDDTVVLYHAGPHKLGIIEPQLGAKDSEYATAKQIYVTPNRAYAAPYALAPHSGANPVHVVNTASYPGRPRQYGYMHRIVLHKGDTLPHAPDHRAPVGAADPSYFRPGKRFTWEEMKQLERDGQRMQRRKEQNSLELVFDEPVPVASARKISKKEVQSTYGVRTKSFKASKPYYYRVVNGKRIKVKNANYR